MKIVFIADCLTTQKAGIHYYARQFIRRIVETYPQHKYYHISSDDYLIEGSENIVVPINKRIPFHYRIRYFTTIANRINDLSPHVAIEMAHFGPFRLHKTIKRATVVHDLTPIFFPDYHDRLSVLWHRYFFKSLLQRSDYIITNSQVTKEDVQTHFDIDKNKISVVYPSVPINLNNKNEKTDSVMQLITVGTIEPRKRHIDILHALEMATDQGFTDWKWVIVGGYGWSYKALLDDIESSPVRDKIIVKGYLTEEELEMEYKRSDYLIYASEYEGFGMPIIEAMSYGVGLLLSDIAIHREVAEVCAHYFSNPGELRHSLFNVPININNLSSYKKRLEEISQLDLPFLS